MVQDAALVERFQKVGLLTKTNKMIKNNILEQTLYCLNVAYNYKPKNIYTVLLTQNKIALKNYKKEYEVDNYGNKVYNRKHKNKRNRLSQDKVFISNFDNSKKVITCPNSCSRI